jgi:hypothetical protein
MTETLNNFEIRADSLFEDSNSTNQSFESVLDIIDAQANVKYNQSQNVLDFLGDSEESTEISSIVSKLNTISNSCRKPERENLNLDMDDSKSEILQILKFKGRANTSSIPLRPVRSNACHKNFGSFGGNDNFKFPANGENKVKKISLAGKILKVKETPEISNFDKIPERLSNPIKLNHDF